MNRDAASIDLRDSARLGTVFVDGLIEDDFTSRGVKRALRDPADDWMQVVRRTVTGFDVTLHFFANHSVELRSAQAAGGC